MEPIQGLHFISTLELKSPGTANTGASYGGWAGVNWFFLPHADVRFDAMQQRMALGRSSIHLTNYMIQLHAYL